MAPEAGTSAVASFSGAARPRGGAGGGGNGGGGRGAAALSPDEARVRAVADIVAALVAGVRDGLDVDLNELKTNVSRAYALSRAPKLVEIIAVRWRAAPLLPTLFGPLPINTHTKTKARRRNGSLRNS